MLLDSCFGTGRMAPSRRFETEGSKQRKRPHDGLLVINEAGDSTVEWVFCAVIKIWSAVY